MSLLIKGVQVIDGSGQPAYKADVLIVGERIVGIGNFGLKSAEKVIHGFGGYLTPGFIDINTDSDHYLSLFLEPSQKNFLLQGVTTIFGGMCGISLAPLIYGDLNIIRWWNTPWLINVNWQTIKEFLLSLKNIRLGVNFGTLVGHYTIRREIVLRNRELSQQEKRIFVRLLDLSLKDGAFGMSSGLGYVSGRNISSEEIESFLPTIKKNRGIYATHLRNYKMNIVDAVKETIDAAKIGLPTIISHFQPIIGFEKKYQKALSIIEENQSSCRLHFDLSPYETNKVSLLEFLPDWLKEDDFSAILAKLSKLGIAERIKKSWTGLNLTEAIIAVAPRQEYLIGKNINTFAKNRELDPETGLLELMKFTKLTASIFIKNINTKLMKEMILHRQSLIASNSASLPENKNLIHERDKNTFPKFLEIAASKISLEEAVKKITKTPADIFGLTNRGIIKEGAIADLVILKDGLIKDVIVAGKVAVADGQLQNISAGKILKHYAKNTKKIF